MNLKRGGGGAILVKFNGLDALLSYQDNYEWVHIEHGERSLHAVCCQSLGHHSTYTDLHACGVFFTMDSTL